MPLLVEHLGYKLGSLNQILGGLGYRNGIAIIDF